MKPQLQRVLYWAPRIMGLLFAMFLSLFALDVFGEGRRISEVLVALFMHLIPVYVVLIILALAWRWEWVGALLFNVLALAYLIWAWGSFNWIAYLLISGPLAVLGLLFLANWVYRAQLHAPQAHG